MAIKLIANYSKRLGLPGYSSHQFSVSIETELITTDDVAGEAERIYQLLQSNVDEQILHTGFVPPADYGMDPPADRGQGGAAPPQQNGANWQRGPGWKCSDKQRELTGHLHLAQADDGFKISGIEGGVDPFAANRLLGFGGFGFKQVEGDPTQRG